MAYQSLYRRYRPQKFSQIRGQQHVVAALQNAVVKAEVGHAYLFHGPRGTGKTSSARVLAKALNCENRGDDGEPCCECESCISIEQGRSFDLHELDAASNNKVDDMRALLAKVNLGTPGRAKVYILDEVHMLTAGAENALLKTLEEPPAHVTWVLATTEPHKVVSTIRSRCQVFELNLLGAEEMEQHVRWLVDDAGIEVDDAAVEHVISAGGGSVRDTLSALDRVVAAGGVMEIDTSTHVLLESLASHDTAAALSAVVDATGRGRDPRRIGETAVAGLRDAFLVAMGAPPPTLTGQSKNQAEALAAKFTPAAITRALETIGTALVKMHQAPDPRVVLEVALVHVCRVESDQSIDALTERIERLELQLASGTVAPSEPNVQTPTIAEAPPEPPAPPPVPTTPSVAPAPSAPTTPPEAPAQSAPPTTGPAGARRALAQQRTGAAPAPDAAPPAIPNDAAPPSTPNASAPQVAAAEADDNPFAPTSPGDVVERAVNRLGMDREHVIARANEILGPRNPGASRTPQELERLWVALVAENDKSEPEPTPDAPSQSREPDVDLDGLVDAMDHDDQVLEQLSQAFPGAELLSNDKDAAND